MKRYNYDIKLEDFGRRLDLTLKEYFKDLSRNYIISLIRLGKVKVNEKIIYLPSYKIKSYGFIELSVEESKEIRSKKNLSLNIVFEDKDLIVVNKQAGILTHKSEKNKSFSLVDLLIQNNITLYEEEDIFRQGVVHRLDKDTSGLIIFAKNYNASSQLKLQFANRTIKKVYEAIVWGKTEPITGTINLSIINYLNRKKISLGSNGKQALTEYKLKKSYLNYFSLVECRIHTGRTHQIRVHMRSIGCPLVGDKLYAKDRNISKGLPLNKAQAVVLFKRQALHAKELSFFHPVKKNKLTFEAQAPSDMKELERTLFD